jgi:predicted dehydrogenase
MSSRWIGAAQKIDDLEMVGLVDIQKEAALKKAEQFKLSDVYLGDSLDQALAETRPDVVFDVTIPSVHKEVVLEALAAGCHVLGEKPMAESMPDALEIVQAAERAGKIYAVIQNRRYDRNIRTVLKILKEGKIGTLHTVNADFYLGPHFGGFREEMKHVLLLDMAIHSFDQARFMSGSNPVGVYCHEYNPEGSWFSHGASAVAVFQMTQGVTFTYRGSWCAQGHPTSWQCQWRLVGSKGTLLWDGDGGISVESCERAEGFDRGRAVVPFEQAAWNPADNGHDGIIRDFVKAVRSGVPPLTHGGDNIHSLAMVLSAIESSELGKHVAIQIQK